MEAFARRGVMQSAFVAAASYGLRAIWPSPAPAAESDAACIPPVTGRVVAWVTLDFARGATMRLAHMEENGASVQEIASRHLEAGDISLADPLRGAVAAAGGFAAQIVARSWDVPSHACRIEPHRIVDTRSGRSVGYMVWLDVV